MISESSETIMIEIMIAICALLTSIVSIFLTMRTLEMQKKHNLKSVRPIGRITAGDYENDVYISIVNEGIGPLIIKNFKASNSQLTSSSIIDIIPKNINDKVIWDDFASNFFNRAIKASGRLYLVRLKFDDTTEERQSANDKLRNDLRRFFQHLTLELEYTDIYEQDTYTVIRELSWFGRHFKDGKNVHKQKYSIRR